MSSDPVRTTQEGLYMLIGSFVEPGHLWELRQSDFKLFFVSLVYEATFLIIDVLTLLVWH